MPVNSFSDYPMSWSPSRDELTGGPTYLALAAALERDIVSGALKPGVRLPPQRELADFLDLNFTTITRAYGICREKGLLYGVTGSGTFVAQNLGESSSFGGDVIELGVVQSFPETGGGIVAAAARDVLSREYASRLFSYGERDGTPGHREAGRKWLEWCGVSVPSSRVAVFPGTQSALSAALLSVFGPGDALAVDLFTYSNLIHLARLAHVRLVPVAGDECGMLPAKLADAVVKGGVKGVYLMPVCANPTTVTMPETRKDELAEVIKRNDLILLEDDSRHSQIRRAERTLFDRIPEQTVYLCGSTRSIASGLRVSYMASPELLSERLLNGLHHLSIKAGAFEAEILGELVLSGAAERILVEKTRQAREANRIFDRVFGRAGRSGSDCFFRTLPIDCVLGKGSDVERQCLEAGVRVCHSDRFSVRKGVKDTFLRVSLSSAGDMKRLKEGLDILRRFIGEHG